MKIAVITATWNRPELLGRMIECFNRQTHEDRTLLILDDTGQYGTNCKGDRWEMLTVPRRIHEYAHKLNALTAMLPLDVEQVAIWDDDDVYLPHALAACSDALERGVWAQPRVIYEPRDRGLLRVSAVLTGGRGCMYHGSWCYRKKVFDEMRGYDSRGPLHFDALFNVEMNKEYGPSEDTASPEHPGPYYIFFRDSNKSHGDDWDSYWPFGEVGYDRRRGKPIVPFPGPLDIRWQVDYTALPVVGEDMTLRNQ